MLSFRNVGYDLSSLDIQSIDTLPLHARHTLILPECVCERIIHPSLSLTLSNLVHYLTDIALEHVRAFKFPYVKKCLNFSFQNIVLCITVRLEVSE